jgi:hypothetical protein
LSISLAGINRILGEIMKKQYLGVVFTFICILGLGLAARAQDESTVVVKVPYDFVIAGKVLPAGSYRTSRVDFPSASRELAISGYETGASALLVPTLFDDAQAGHAQFSFERIGNKYYLSAVETPIGRYAISIPTSATKLAQTKPLGESPSGSN